MQTPLDLIAAAVRAAIVAATGAEADPLVTPAQNPEFGDYQSNAAMGLAKRLSQETGEKTNPRALAEKIKASLNLGGAAAEVSIAGPGFLNVRLAPAWVAARLAEMAADAKLGVPTAAEPQTVVVEYSSPNVAKQMHVGHIRSTILGDAAARILGFLGHTVIRQNHIGDWGTQFGMLIAYTERVRENYAEKRDRHAGMKGIVDDSLSYSYEDRPTKDVAIYNLEAFYRNAKQAFDADEAFRDEARLAVVELQSGSPEAGKTWRQIVEASRRHFEPIYERLGVLLTRADERGESFYNPRLEPLVQSLQAAGVAEVSDGATVVFTEGEKAPLMVRKSDGGFGYGTTDLAAIDFRAADLHADRIVYLVDARQAQHFRQVFAAAKKAGLATPAVLLEHASFGSVLGEDGRPFKTRTGGTVKLIDLLDEAESRALEIVREKNPDWPEDRLREVATAVGIGALKYADLSKDRTSDYVFSFDQMLSFEGNTGPYLQYAHARTRAILRKAESEFGPPFELSDPHEVALAKHLLRFGEVVQLVGRELRPHQLCAYLYELATRFSGFYEHCPVLASEGSVRASRLALCDLTGRTLAKGLDLLGIEHPEQM